MAASNSHTVSTPRADAVLAAEFAGCMEALELPSSVSYLAVAVSGGADSMALAILMADWAETRNITLHALTVDHNIRKNAAHEAEQVAEWMAARAINHHILHHTEAVKNANMQAQARDIRYGLMADWCQTHHIAHLLLAHHEDDQAETFLLRLGRGSGVDGLSAMRPTAHRYGITLLRPLLRLPKERLLATLNLHNQPWIEDPSNQNPAFMRTHMRALLEPLASVGITPAKLADTAERMARAQQFLELTAQAAYDSLVVSDHQTLWLNRTGFAALNTEIALRVLTQTIQTLTHDPYRPRFEKLSLLYDALTDLKKPVNRTLAHCQFTSHIDGSVEITRTRA